MPASGAGSGMTGFATVAFSGTSFTLTWNTTTATPFIHYIAIGGSDITNAKVETYDTGTTTTGNIGYTGIGFQGDFAFFISGHNTITVDRTQANGGLIHGGIGMGAATSSSRRWAVTTLSESGRDPSDTWRYQKTDKCLTLLTNTTGAVDSEADFVSFDVDGFTLNWTDAPLSNLTDFAALIIEGGVWEVGAFHSLVQLEILTLTLLTLP